MPHLLVLGSSSQTPTRHRNHNGYLLLWDGGDGFLFDPGEGTQRQMTMFGARASQITRICVTHFHGDHCLGLPGMVQRIHGEKVPHPVHVHFPGSGEVYWERLANASIHDATGDVRPVPHDAPGVIASTASFTLTTAQLDHRAPAWGYRVQEPDGWTVDADEAAARGVVGPRIGVLKRHGEVTVDGVRVRIDEVARPRRGFSFAFVMDTRPCTGALELARDVDLLVCESTYLSTEAELAAAYAHMTADDAGRLAAQAGARRLLLTHFSQRYPLDAPFAEEAGKHHGDVLVAYDGQHVDFPPRRVS